MGWHLKVRKCCSETGTHEVNEDNTGAMLHGEEEHSRQIEVLILTN